MKRIKELKLALMEKEIDSSYNENGKGSFIIKCFGTLDVESVLKDITDEEQYNEYILYIASSIYEELMSKKEDKIIDNVGLWLTYEDGILVDNSMGISMFNDIEKFANVNPLIEFVKMTLSLEVEQNS